MAPKSRGQKEADAPKVLFDASKVTIVAEDEKPAQPPWRIIATAIAIMVLAGLASPISQANLSPVYGSIPAAIYHHQGTTYVTMAAFIITKLPYAKSLPSNLKLFLPIMAYATPVIQFYLFPYSSNLGAEKGPLVTELLTFYPLLLLAYLASSSLLQSLDASSAIRTYTDAIRPAISYGIFYGSQQLTSNILPRTIGDGEFLSRTGLSLVIASFYAFLGQSSWLMLCTPGLLHTMFVNHHHQSMNTIKHLNKTMAALDYTLLERRDSFTGYVSVLESHENQYRVMRCDHSLLGGEWLVSEERRQQGQTQTETIYSVFTMLESVRLVESERERVDSESKALFIGLGIGTSPTAFINHGISTDIVELDPVVHEFAMKYFGLPENHTAFIQDAVNFVDLFSRTQPRSYDYIVHDVFTGGAEPTALFTLEFLRGLETLLKDDGVIAINYAGDITLPPPRIVLNTIHAVFTTCRIFRDAPETEDSTNFINMVVFCTKSKTGSLEFRIGTEADWKGSLSRREYVPPKPELEIKLEDIWNKSGDGEFQILKKGNEGIIEKYHRDHAVRHWELMRTVLPDAIWENW